LLPDSLHDPALSLSIFRRRLKTHFLGINDEMYSAIRDFFYENALYKFTLDLHANLLKPDGIIVIDEDLDI